MQETGIILCVDDDSTVLNALRSMFATHFGSELEVEFAESGDEALEIEADMRSQGREIGLVLSDFIMPGMRGDELLVGLDLADRDGTRVLVSSTLRLAHVVEGVRSLRVTAD